MRENVNARSYNVNRDDTDVVGQNFSESHAEEAFQPEQENSIHGEGDFNWIMIAYHNITFYPRMNETYICILWYLNYSFQ